ncbi:MAG: ROK family protein [Gemmataceae bacterium]|nr:ROK family protein [Gemmataceae bacterium]
MSLARPDLLRRLNERRVLDLVRAAGACSRADLTRRTGISAPTVSRLVSALLEAGVLEEFDAVEARIGRPSKQLRLVGDRAQVLGLTLGVHETRLFAAGLDGAIDSKSLHTFSTPATYEGILNELGSAVRPLKRRARRTLGLGVSVPGLLDEDQGRSLFSPNLHQTDGQPLAADLARVAGMDVTIVQESRALCLAERHYGGARDLRDFLVVDIGDGVGVGIVLDGRMVVGRKGLAGEFGHMTVEPNGPRCGCGNRGCLETRCSNRAVLERAEQLYGRPITITEAVQQARDGDSRLLAIFDDTLPWLAIGLASLINGLNPEAVFLHSPMLDLGGDVLERLEELTRARALPTSMDGCRFVRAQGCKDQGAVGAAIERLVSARGPLLGTA